MEHDALPSKADAQTDLTPSLVRRLRGGDDEAGALLHRMYGEAIVRFCAGYLGRADEADDAAQEVFCRVLTAQEVPDAFRPWLYKIARNYCRNLMRDQARRGRPGGLPTASRLGASWTGDLTRLVRAERRERLADLVNRLGDELREVLQLRYAEGLSRAETAEVLGVPESVVKSRTFKGLQALRAHPSLIQDV